MLLQFTFKGLISEKESLSGEFIVCYQIISFHKQTKGDLRNLQILF